MPSPLVAAQCDLYSPVKGSPVHRPPYPLPPPRRNEARFNLKRRTSLLEFRLGYEHVPRSKVWLKGWNSSPRTESCSRRREICDHALNPSCPPLARPVCRRQRSTASCLATATMAFLRCAPVARAPLLSTPSRFCTGG